ncbi:uncharacterized protein A1O5_10983 [Cladophialophora psammophila CBS 110553]|uniref:Potassium channel domain-containing protein n=1 Tax=Cladophialophora psammophila CBS 110553 TaxID=1182543 RepID=W9WMZ0_9EURO|nr:uncharacterized protein A1O5_10983 [Cladophialophora psammophila CBS 110553]EXJ66006.1 hypothetical protein A1O5_10983 [Cladophialophora psammophila CBS 110553]
MNDSRPDESFGNQDQPDHLRHKAGCDADSDEDENNHLQPATWGYANMVFPLLAGTFGPLANAFSICAMAENWTVQVTNTEHRLNTKHLPRLIAANAVSLVLALTANLALLLHMARRLPFAVAQSITILGFWCASILLIGPVAKVAYDLHSAQGRNYVLSQAYYYAIFAVGLYQLISYILCVTVYGACKGHYGYEFKLTTAQRTLMLQTIVFLAYLLVWALVYSKVEGWTYLDAVFFADFTALTIGIGSPFVPTTHLGRSLLFPFAFSIILVLGIVVGSIRTLVLDRTEVDLASLMTEKTRQRVLKRIAKASQAAQSGKTRGKVIGLPEEIAATLTRNPEAHKIGEMELRQAEFEAMRRVQHLATLKKRWFRLFASTLAFALLWTVGALVFTKTEENQNWSYFVALYFSYTSLLTIGYGDFQPTSNSGKPWFVFWTLMAVPTLTILISNMSDTVVKVAKEFTIWIGEVTILPSENRGIMDRLKLGLYKSTLGLIPLDLSSDRAADNRSDDEAMDIERFQELNPRLFKMRRQRIAEDLTQSTMQGRAEEKASGNNIGSDEDYYGRLLVSHIRKVWNDVKATPDKKYSYVEWAFYLSLLGEGENDDRHHRRPQAEGIQRYPSLKERFDAHQNGRGSQERRTSSKPGHDPDQQSDTQITKWSWMGRDSPLMADKPESEWLLNKLLARLQDSLRQHGQECLMKVEGDPRAETEQRAGPSSSINLNAV